MSFAFSGNSARVFSVPIFAVSLGHLERLKLGLTWCIGCGYLSIDSCSLANPQHRLGDSLSDQESRQVSAALPVGTPGKGLEAS
jgi:hypothetical protein